MDINEFFERIATFFRSYGLNILAAVLIFIIGWFLISLLSKLLLKLIYVTPIDNAVGSFVVAMLRVGLWVGLAFLILNTLGVSGQNFLVMLSSMALAVGLALKDSLSNVACGIIIIFNKPFKKGDHVEVGGDEGIVRSIRLLTTEVTTFDNKKIVMPNSKMVSNSVINYTSSPTRRVSAIASVAYGSDRNLTKKVLLEMVSSNPLVLRKPAPVVILKELGESSLNYEIRAWVKTSDYFTVNTGMNDAIMDTLDKYNIEVPFNQLDINFRTPIPTAAPVVSAPAAKTPGESRLDAIIQEDIDEEAAGKKDTEIESARKEA